ncbi:hypothetical protein VTN96DRAFT_7436 [Rasamsonia emersonii]
MESRTKPQPLSTKETGMSALQGSEQVSDASSLIRPMSSLTVTRRLVDSDPDEVFELIRLFQEDSSIQKVDLGIGVYRDDDGKPWPLPVVSKVEMKLFFDGGRHRHEYLPMKGDPEFMKLAQDLLFGFDAPLAQIKLTKLTLIIDRVSTTFLFLRLMAERASCLCKRPVVAVPTPFVPSI